ncbi:hypothetical protein P7K49_032275 [Saguinus oedipus]|uniref:Uncharacterized protein n=1 Tax=Saguinus oedipus TaxID=9490 RepID=A0ABQ9TXT7_SAGOE|nr:hypothetical protein P7K49_032275 [Saguinus oedipus]
MCHRGPGVWDTRFRRVGTERNGGALGGLPRGPRWLLLVTVAAQPSTSEQQVSGRPGHHSVRFWCPKASWRLLAPLPPAAGSLRPGWKDFTLLGGALLWGSNETSGSRSWEGCAGLWSPGSQRWGRETTSAVGRRTVVTGVPRPQDASRAPARRSTRNRKVLPFAFGAAKPVIFAGRWVCNCASQLLPGGARRAGLQARPPTAQRAGPGARHGRPGAQWAAEGPGSGPLASREPPAVPRGRRALSSRRSSPLARCRFLPFLLNEAKTPLSQPLPLRAVAQGGRYGSAQG